MPSYFTQIFSNVMAPPAVKRNLDFSYRHMPMLNEVSTSLSSYLASQGQISRKKALMRWYKNTPELVGFINKVLNDMCMFYHFENVGQGNGKNRIMKANRFALENNFRMLREEVDADMMITGDGFVWKALIGDDVIKDKIKEVMGRYESLESTGRVPKLSKESKEKIMHEIKSSMDTDTDMIDSTSKFLDEDVLALKKIRYMPSTTVEVVYDRYDIKGYNHFLGVYLPMFFRPEEVIHMVLMKRDGKVNGFTPVESVIVQIELLRQMWQNQLALHMNGGSPDKIFNVENLQVSSPAYKRIEEQIAKYRLAENKHGNMLFTGKVNVLELQQLDQMQFKDSGLYITGLIAMQWGLPRSSIPFIIGGTNTKDDTGGNAERGYWQMIRGLQLKEAEFWNTQLWIPHFGVKLVPEVSYPQLDVQEQAALQAKVQNIQNIDALLLKEKKMISHEKKMDILGFSDEDIEDAPEEEINKMMGLNPDGSDPNVMNTGTPKTSKDKPQSDQGVGKAVAKRQEQQNTIASRGKPTGYGKELLSDPEFKTFVAGVIQQAVIHTQYENQPKVRKDEPIQQLSATSTMEPLTDTAGAEMPADWAISKDNKVSEPYPEKNMISQPKIQPQLNTYPTGSITTENLYNPAGNIGYPSGTKYGGDNDYVEVDKEDKPSPTKPVKKKGSYPSQRKYPDEPTQFPGKDEKESQMEMGMRVEEEHRDVYDFIQSYLRMNKVLPEWTDVKKRIVEGHLDEVRDYYSRLKKVEGDKESDEKSILEIKEHIEGKEVEDVGIDTFAKLYQEDRRFHPGQPPKILMRKTNGSIPIYTLKFKSNDFVYKTSISETDLHTPKADILLSNIAGNIVRL